MRKKLAQTDLKNGEDEDLWYLYKTDGRPRHKDANLIDYLIPNSNKACSRCEYHVVLVSLVSVGSWHVSCSTAANSDGLQTCYSLCIII